MSKIKLYTEEQLLNTVKAVLEYDNKLRIEKHLKALQPIELPSDEDIDKKLSYHAEGAKWVIEKIKQQADVRN